MWAKLMPLLVTVALGGGVLSVTTKELLECASQILCVDQNMYQNYSSSYCNRNTPPDNNTTVYIGLKVKRVSGVDENKQEITLDVFLQVSWEEKRLHLLPEGAAFVDLPWEYRQLIWTPDLYISQLQSMKIMSVLQEMASLRLYSNGTVSVSIGAMITIKCDMDFVLYPLDVQKCPIDFSSYKYTTHEVHFEWRNMGGAWLGLGGDQRDHCRLPKYVVTFSTEQSNQSLFGEGEHSAARLVITLSRELRGYLLESYLPSSLFVIMSWGSFCVIPEIVPGRMVLLVTTLLSLITMFDTVSTNSPDALELKCIEVWLISCTIFVFLALLEYFVVLFGIRYDKNWSRRRQDLRRAASAAQLAPPPLIINHSPRPSLGSPGPPAAPVFSTQLTSEDEGLKQQFEHQTIQRDSPIFESVASGSTPTTWRLRIGAQVDKAVMFCGAQHGSMDRYALMVFPICFILFASIYWTTYLSEAYIKMQK